MATDITPPGLFSALHAAISDPGRVVAREWYPAAGTLETVGHWSARAVAQAIGPFLAKPAAHDPMTDCTCEPGDVLSERGICEYRQLADSVDEAFNPPGDDVAEVAILIGAVERARDALEAMPCACTLAMVADWDQCARCAALGQRGGKAVER